MSLASSVVNSPSVVSAPSSQPARPWRNPLLRSHSVLPGFNMALGVSVLYLSLLVLIPLAAVLLTAGTLGWSEFVSIATDPQVVASYKLTFGTSLAAAVLNAVFGLLVAWVLVRYEFAGRRLVDAMVDLPFALPTAVAGIALTGLYAENGWIGSLLPFKVSFTPLGVLVALTFIGLPFVVRTVQPVLQDLHREQEEAAAMLGASRWQTFRYVVLPTLTPALLTGFSLALARALGEFGSVIFIAGNIPFETEITSVLIIAKIEQQDTPGASVIAVVMLAAAFVMLLAINLLQAWKQRQQSV